MNNYQEIVHTKVEQVFSNLKKHKTLVVYSPTTYKRAQKAGLINPVSFKELKTLGISNKSDRVSYDTLERFDLSQFEVFVGFGGGTVIDVAKFLACKYDKKCVAIPSMLSTNVFATNKIAAIRKNGKHTEDSKLPEEVVYDEELLNLTKTESLYGLTDAFSIYTALKDWVISHQMHKELIDESIYHQAEDILSEAYTLIPKQTTFGIFQVLQQAGYITNDYGCGRPESGSEHIIAKEIENLVSVPHALAVTCGIAITSQLQNSYDDAVQPLKNIGVFQQIKHSIISPEILEKALENVTPRTDRYTVLDTFCPLKQRIPELISRSHLYD